MDKTTVYILSLMGDVQSTGCGAVVFEVAGVSHDRAVLEALKVKKDEWLESHFGDVTGEDDEYTLYNTDLTGRPWWEITEHVALT